MKLITCPSCKHQFEPPNCITLTKKNNIYNNNIYNNKSLLKLMQVGEIESVIEYLNEKAGRTGRDKFSPKAEATVERIQHLYRAGYTADDMKRAIDNCCRLWLGTERDGALNPSTIFGRKFDHWLTWRFKDEPKEQKEQPRKVTFREGPTV